MDSAPPAVTSHLGSLLPSLAGAAAAGARLLHDRRLARVWAALDPAPGLLLSPAHGPGAGRLYELAGESDQGRWALAISALDDTALALASAAAGPGGRLRTLVLNALLGEPLARIAAALPGARVLALTPAPVAAPEEPWCVLRRAGVELCRIAVRELAPGVEQALRAARRPGGAQEGAGWRRAMRLAAAVSVAERRMSVALIRSLEPGDVLVLPGAAAADTELAGVLHLRAGAGTTLGARARIAGHAITLLEGLHLMDQDTLPPAAPAGAAESLGELELPLRFEIETVSIALADLEAIEPGYVIEFDTPVAQARLRLVACGLVIGEADLIAVGNRLGARITHLAPRHESEQQRG